MRKGIEYQREACARATFIFMTQSYAGMENGVFIEALKNEFDCIITDEAAQSTEPQQLFPLAKLCKCFILVGDHLQLRAIVNNSDGSRVHSDKSLFERLADANPDGILMLNVQYRMHPIIASWPSQFFYRGLLLNGDNTERLKNHPSPLVFIDTVGDCRNNGTSKFNLQEAIMCVNLIQKVLRFYGRNTNTSVGVISFYSAQTNEIMRLLKGTDIHTDNVMVGNVDPFQGGEKDVIIISCVRQGSGIGFLDNPRRLVGALSNINARMLHSPELAKCAL